jgi:protein-S-isoprenylcysteine O-methyltransferase Ste14
MVAERGVYTGQPEKRTREEPSMKTNRTGTTGNLIRPAILGFVRMLVTLAVIFFVSAWTLDYWQAWLFLFLFAASILFITLYFLKHDPALIERRLNVGPRAEQRESQKIIQAIAGALLFITMLIPGFDHRFAWSSVPTPLVLIADALLLLGLLIIFRVFKENSYTASTVTVEEHQRVISTGPYRWVRHPMYAGSALGFIAAPVALGSFWALIPAVLLSGTMVVRLLDEERYLSANLPGYDDYRRQVRYRLIPYLW